MRSSDVQGEAGADDRTTRARIRDAAIDCIAQHGLTDTTVRKIAAAAGVSPGLVIHHFGSMDALREACDQHVADEIRRQKSAALSSGPRPDPGPSAVRRSPHTPPWPG